MTGPGAAATLAPITAHRSPDPPLRLRAFELPVAALLLAALTLWLHRGAFTGEWAYDDLRILRHALEFPCWKHFLDRDSWQLFSVANLTPLQILSYQLDVWLFGPARPAFAGHQLVALWAAAVATWLLLRAALRGLWPLFGSALLLCSVPAAAVATNLWNRQYIEGLALCTLALLLALRAARSGSSAWAWPGAVLYLLACAAKEVFVPALLVLPFLPAGTWRTRVRALWPFAVAAALYVPWRHHMLGGAVGGYEMIKPTLMDQLRLYRIPALLFGHDLLGKAARVALLLLLGPWLVLAPKRIPLALAGLLALLGPLLPIASTVYHADRYLLVAAWLVALLCPVAARAVAAQRTWLLLPVLAALALPAAAMVAERGRFLTRQERAASDPALALVSRFLLEARADEALFLRPPLADEQFQYLYEWRWIVRRFRPEGTPTLLVDECELEGRSGPVWSWQPDRAAVVEITSAVPALLDSWRARTRTRSLSVDVVVDTSAGVILHFGPSREGTYTLVSGRGFGRALRFAVGREHSSVAVEGIRGRLPMFEMRSHVRDTFFGTVTFRVRHEAPDGTLSYSPELTFDGARASNLAWRR